ncbi:copper homeostasis protein CutC, partial [Cladochytrium replicatum]
MPQIHRILEVCLDSVDSAVTAASHSADRVELCGNLVEGGTTPSAGAVRLARSLLPRSTLVHVMIRPRGGDFAYTDIEFEVMKSDIAHAKEAGADGVVFGLLRPDGTIDVERTTELVRLANPMNVTFHRAFDVSSDPFKALEDITSIGGIERILTSGQEESVLEGLPLIKDLIRRAGNRIVILPGGGISPRNVERIVSKLQP